MFDFSKISEKFQKLSLGSLMAIMGSSGSGKTTFLNYLTRNINDDLKISGDIRINGIDIGLVFYCSLVLTLVKYYCIFAIEASLGEVLYGIT